MRVLRCWLVVLDRLLPVALTRAEAEATHSRKPIHLRRLPRAMGMATACHWAAAPFSISISKHHHPLNIINKLMAVSPAVAHRLTTWREAADRAASFHSRDPHTLNSRPCVALYKSRRTRTPPPLPEGQADGTRIDMAILSGSPVAGLGSAWVRVWVWGGRRASTSRPSFSSMSGPMFLQNSIYGPGSSNSNAIPIRHIPPLDDSDDSDSDDDLMQHHSPQHPMPPAQASRRRSSAAGHHLGAGAPAPATSTTTNPPFAPVGGEDAFQLPTRWNEDDRSHQVNVSPDGREAHFAGEYPNPLRKLSYLSLISSSTGMVSSSERDAAAVRAKFSDAQSVRYLLL